jgi:hypothetical protein
MLSCSAKSSRSRGSQKLDLDIVASLGRHAAIAVKPPIDPNPNEFALQLCTRIGMMTKDLTPVALDASHEGLEARVAEVAPGVKTMAAVVPAVEAPIEGWRFRATCRRSSPGGPIPKRPSFIF